MDVAHAIALVARLVQRAPSDAPQGVADALERLRVRAGSLDAAWVLRAVKPAPTLTKPPVVRLIGTWGALQGRLISWTRIAADAPVEAADAQRLLDEVLGDGLRFLKMEHDALWVESARRVALLEDPSRAPQVEVLAGAPFVEAVRVSHKLCGDALGLTAPEEPEEGVVDLMAPLNEVRSAVAAYALQLLAATVDSVSERAMSLSTMAPPTEPRAPLIPRSPRVRAPVARRSPPTTTPRRAPPPRSAASPDEAIAAGGAVPAPLAPVPPRVVDRRPRNGDP